MKKEEEEEEGEEDGGTKRKSDREDSVFLALQLCLIGRECHVRARTVADDNIKDQMDGTCNAAYQVMAPLVMWLISVRAAGRAAVI